MKTMVCGSRVLDSATLLDEALADAMAHGLWPTALLHGGARGIDQLAGHWAATHGLPCTVLQPDWTRFGRGAALQRNLELVRRADVVVAVHCGTSGTLHALRAATARGLPIFEYRVVRGAITRISRPADWHREGG